ncbi:MAG: benzoyl-CoA-dihydrodiol lyase [Alphaproteobacteria bacterium]|nr:benzoyl-CoA-dihydrodiol lyase [Alphaproteobacteria bacterium]
MASDAPSQHIESFHAHPSTYKHWKLSLDGAVAHLVLDVKEENGLRPDDYVLKQNSYDLGVDIELNDAIERLRFEHPEVRALVMESAQAKVFCAGANIRMLATSTHSFKVNFCKYTNETRVGLEEASEQSGIKTIAALNGTAAGGGYELALACDEIMLIDDGNSAVSLPEVPLLGVLPGTGGLTRLVDKRKVRRDVADLFCTKAEGFRARDAVKYRLVDASVPRSKWEEGVAKRAAELADRPAPATKGIELIEVSSKVDAEGVRRWKHVELAIDEEQRVARLTLHAPTDEAPTVDQLRAQGSESWLLRAWREMEDALLHLRFNHEQVGLWLLHTRGDAEKVLAHDAVLLANQDDWLCREIRLKQARVLRRFDNTARSMFAIVDPGSCWAGSIFELLLSADRSYMLQDEDEAVTVRVTRAASDGAYPMATGITRLQARFAGEPEKVGEALQTDGEPLAAEQALDMGLVTLTPDDIDWDDELRIAIEERVSLSPDALTGMEQNLRFVGSENCDSKIFGRLSAWQNWIFQRPNAVGEEGALTLYGHPTRPRFDWRRT